MTVKDQGSSLQDGESNNFKSYIIVITDKFTLKVELKGKFFVYENAGVKKKTTRSYINTKGLVL